MEKEINFQKELNNLDEIVSKIESGELSLDESIKLYEQGQKIIKNLEDALKEAKTKVEKIIEVK